MKFFYAFVVLFGMINFLSLMIACGMMPNVLVEVKILESLVNLDVMVFNSLSKWWIMLWSIIT